VQNADQARFCSHCGTRLAPPTARTDEVRKTVTVVFTDVAGSTSLGERHDPEQLRQVISRYFEQTRSVLERHGGTVEKFIGDAVMAVFGLPVVHEDDALRALRAAIEMREALAVLNEDLHESFGIRLDVRTGVNTGEVIAGDPGHGQAFVTGDAVNVAERLERGARPGEILLGEETRRLARDSIEVERVGPVQAEGKEQAVVAYRLLGVAPGLRTRIRRFDSPLVGRVRERQLLRDAFLRCAQENRCHLFTILGLAGVGKSRLVAEIIDELGPRATAVVGSCLPYGDGITFWPVREVVEQAAGVSDDDTPDDMRRKLGAALEGEPDADAVVGSVGELMGLGTGARAAEETFWGVRKLLEATARKRPLVVVFEDVNWGEPTFLDLVDHLADWSRESPILLVCTARPELLDARPGWGGGKLNATSMLVEPLTELESERLLQNLLGRGEVDERVRDRIHTASEGNPLFVEQMLSMLVDDGLLHQEGGRWTTTRDPAQIRVPPSIQVLLATRLDQLGLEERRVLEHGAVEGRVFHRGAVEALSEENERARIPACLQALVRKELSRPHRPTFPGEDAFRFRHVLIRDAAYDSIPKQLRGQLHERFASWLERIAGDRTLEYEEFLAYHLEQAFRYRAELGRVETKSRTLAERAATHYTSAGRRALVRGDVPAAIKLLRRADSVLEAIGARQPDVLIELGSALQEDGDLAGAEDAISRAGEVADTIGDDRSWNRSALELSLLRAFVDTSVDADVLRGAAERAIDALTQAGDDLGLARAWRNIAQARWIECHYGRMEDALTRALVHAERAGDPRELSGVLSLLARAAVLGPKPVDEVIRHCEDLRRRASGNRALEAWIDGMLALPEAMRGNFSEARRLSRTSEETLRDLGLKVTLTAVHMYGGLAELLADEASAAEQAFRGGYALLERMGERSQLSTMAAVLARALAAQEEFQAAEEFTGVSLDAAADDDVASQAIARGTLARIIARRGERDRAEALARDAVARLGDSDFLSLRADILVDFADVLRLVERPGEAERVLAEALSLYEAKGNVVSARKVRALLLELAAARSA
jgi:class 3 adenylate cyclase/tetratricopeptide (TPR) repeat protein